jgi:hypothetical protein
MTTTGWKNEIEYPAYPCPRCGVTCWIVGHYVDAGGAPKYPFVCYSCRHRTPHFAKRRLVERSGVAVEELHPLLLPTVCEVCHAEGAEWHHWAPTSIFGDEAEKWPKSALCRACHVRWHQLVTPNKT